MNDHGLKSAVQRIDLQFLYKNSVEFFVSSYINQMNAKHLCFRRVCENRPAPIGRFSNLLQGVHPQTKV